MDPTVAVSRCDLDGITLVVILNGRRVVHSDDGATIRRHICELGGGCGYGFIGKLRSIDLSKCTASHRHDNEAEIENSR